MVQVMECSLLRLIHEKGEGSYLSVVLSVCIRRLSIEIDSEVLYL